MKLLSFQRPGVAFLVKNRRAILADPMGTGKTAQMIRTLQVLAAMGENPFPALVVCPNSLKLSTWSVELESWAPELKAQVIDGTAGQRRKQLAVDADVFILNWESVRLHSRLAGYGTIALSEKEKTPKELNEMGLRTVVADECVTSDTVISTQRGRLPIHEVRQGDRVLGVDHVTGERVWSTVQGVRRSTLRETVSIGSLKITPEHPVWVGEEGQLCYASTSSTGEELRTVRGAVPDTEGASAVLFQELPEPDDGKPSGDPRSSCGAHEGTTQAPGCAGEASATSRRSIQSVPGPGGTGTIRRDSAQAWVSSPQWRKRYGSYRPAGDVARSAGEPLGTGVPGVRLATNSGVSGFVQAGSGAPDPQSRDRGARPGPREEGRARDGEGPEEASVPGGTWLEGSVGVERGDPDRSLWNLETATGNYFANGVLVHNCHKMKDPKAAQTRALWAVMHQAEFRYLMTGTPIAQNIGDLWSLLHGVEPTWFPAKTKFLDRHAQTSLNHFGGLDVHGIKPETKDEFFKIVDPLIRRIPKEAALPQLPPKLPVQIRHTSMTPKQKKAYVEMRDTMIAQLNDLLVAPNPLSQLTRLSQFAAASAEIAEDGSIRLAAPSAKVDDLADLLEETGDEPLVVAAVSRQLIELASERLTKLKIGHGLVTGAQSVYERQEAVRRFQEGHLRVIMLTLGAGAEGITLTRASRMLFMQDSYSAIQNQQAEDRIHRIGSEIHDSIQIIKQITPDTVEETKQEILATKGMRMEEVVRDRETLLKLLGAA